jgi:hypothetical protein
VLQKYVRSEEERKRGREEERKRGREEERKRGREEGEQRCERMGVMKQPNTPSLRPKHEYKRRARSCHIVERRGSQAGGRVGKIQRPGV